MVTDRCRCLDGVECAPAESSFGRQTPPLFYRFSFSAHFPGCLPHCVTASAEERTGFSFLLS